MARTSAIPLPYYFLFAIYEPALTVVGFLGAIADPKKTHDNQAPWPGNEVPLGPLPKATYVTILQMGHVCALLGLINAFVLSATRKYLSSQPAIQERIVGALLTPLVFGDIIHILITLWALGPDGSIDKWTPLTWMTIVLGLTLLIPRVLWHLGVGRYKHERDGIAAKTE